MLLIYLSDIIFELSKNPQILSFRFEVDTEKIVQVERNVSRTNLIILLRSTSCGWC